MKPACSLLLFFFVAGAATAQSYEPVRSGNLYGFSDHGRMIIPAAFQYATHFHEGLALVKQNGKWGYIDSTGAWIVPPKFDNAEPFHGKSAFVYVKGKTGVIDTNGKYLAEPVHDSLERTFYGIEITHNGRKGLISEKYGNIPVGYTDFYFNYSDPGGFLYAQRGKNDFDLYLDGKLLLKGLDRGLNYGDLLQDFGLLRVSYGHKFGMLRMNGEWAVEPKYDRIEYIVVQGVDTQDPDHAVKGNGQLLKMEQWITPEDSDPVPLYSLAYMDGSLISDLPFETANLITHDYWDGRPDELELRQGGKIVYLKPDMTLERTPYVSIIHHFGWTVCDDGSMTHLFDAEGNEKLTYDEIITPQQQSVYDDNGLIAGEMPYAYSPYVHIGELRGDVLYWAIYHLAEQRIITEWMPEEIGVTITEMPGGQQLFSFYTAMKERYSWYYSGTGSPVPFVYTGFTPYNDRYFSARAEGSDNTDVYAIEPYAAPRIVLSAPVTGISTQLMTTSYQADEETGEVYTIYDFPFTRPFVYYKDAAGKYGLIADDQTIVPAQYDSLAPNGPVDFVVLVQKNGKWAAVDTRNGDRFEPVFDEPRSFGYEGPDFLCTALPDQLCYMNIKGQKFWSLNNEYYIFKEGGRIGLKVYPDFTGENDLEEMKVAIPAMYKSIEQNDDGYPNRFRAKGSNGKYGIINGFNDTIMPFIYSTIEDNFDNEAYYGDGPSYYYVNTAIGKKKGIADLATGAQLPARFDAVTNLYNSYGSQLGFRTESDGKFGLYSAELEEILPCEYDALYISNFHGDYNEVYLHRNGKWQVVNTQNTEGLRLRQLEKLPQYDLIVDSSGYVKTASGYDRYDVFSGKIIASGLSQPDFSVWQSDYKLFLDEGMIGVKDANGKVVLKPQLTAISWTDEATVTGAPAGELYYYVLPLNKRYTADQW